MRADTSDVLLDRLLALHPKIIDLTLDRVWRLLEDLQSPERDLPPVVHVAGTNGKGSTLAMIRAGLEAGGHRVHAYTSPHLVRFHERIRLAGDLIAEDHLAALLAECEDKNAGEQITFFEITTVAAFLAFARTPADYTLLEVGLGGRLDATNVIDKPKVCAITPISLDHQQFLGEIIEEIAGEKAGILKPDVPCAVSHQSDAVLAVLRERAERVGAPLLVHGEDWLVRQEHGRVVFQDESGLLDLDPPRLIGRHQIQNAGTSIAVLRMLGASDEACQAALLDAEWPARMHRLGLGSLGDDLPPGSELWLDGGHNASAGEAIAAVLDDWHAARPMPVCIVVGMLNTKSAGDYLRPIIPRVATVITVEIPQSEASFSADELAGIVEEIGASAATAVSVGAALSAISVDAEQPVRVLICGSLYLAGHVLGLAG